MTAIACIIGGVYHYSHTLVGLTPRSVVSLPDTPNHLI